MLTVLVEGSGDVGSAIAHALFKAGHSVVLQDEPKPAHSRRTMAFTDAAFEGIAELEGVLAKRARTMDAVPIMLRCHRAIPVVIQQLSEAREVVRADVIVDARMRKRSKPEVQRGLAKMVIGVGPNFRAGENADVVIETAWGDQLGAVITEGASQPLAGEPRELSGHGRERFVYAPASGVFTTDRVIGDNARLGELIGRIGVHEVLAPLEGTIRGLAHDGAAVEPGTKLLEIDAGPQGRVPAGVGPRPRAIAHAVVAAVEAVASRFGVSGAV